MDTRPSDSVSLLLDHYQRAVQTMLDHDFCPGATSEELELFKSQFRTSAYTCRVRSCPRASIGFESEKLRCEHEIVHAGGFRCSFPGCQYPTPRTAQALQAHMEKYHASTLARKSIRRVGRLPKNDKVTNSLGRATVQSPGPDLVSDTMAPQHQSNTMPIFGNTGHSFETTEDFTAWFFDEPNTERPVASNKGQIPEKHGGASVKQSWSNPGDPYTKYQSCDACSVNRRTCDGGVPCEPCRLRKEFCLYTLGLPKARTRPENEEGTASSVQSNGPDYQSRDNLHFFAPLKEGWSYESIRCICPSKKKIGMMIACQLCHTYQHVSCYFDFGVFSRFESLLHSCHVCCPQNLDVLPWNSRNIERRQELGLRVSRTDLARPLANHIVRPPPGQADMSSDEERTSEDANTSSEQPVVKDMDGTGPIERNYTGVWTKCTACRGQGTLSEPITLGPQHKCPDCEGTGYVLAPAEEYDKEDRDVLTLVEDDYKEDRNWSMFATPALSTGSSQHSSGHSGSQNSIYDAPQTGLRNGEMSALEYPSSPRNTQAGESSHRLVNGQDKQKKAASMGGREEQRVGLAQESNEVEQQVQWSPSLQSREDELVISSIDKTDQKIVAGVLGGKTFVGAWYRRFLGTIIRYTNMQNLWVLDAKPEALPQDMDDLEKLWELVGFWTFELFSTTDAGSFHLDPWKVANVVFNSHLKSLLTLIETEPMMAQSSRAWLWMTHHVPPESRYYHLLCMVSARNSGNLVGYGALITWRIRLGELLKQMKTWWDGNSPRLMRRRSITHSGAFPK